MGTRKRHGGQQNAKQDESTSKTKRKSSPPRTSKQSGLSPALAASVLIALILATGGVYIYNFVDMTDALDVLQNRVTRMVYPDYMGEPNSAKSQRETPQTATPPVTPSTEKKTEKKSEKKKTGYAKSSITSSYDNKIRVQLDEADGYFDKGRFEKSLNGFEEILSRYPSSPRAHVGRATCLDEISQQKKSNALLEQCIEEYSKVLDLQDVPKELMLKAGKRCADRQSFRGWGGKAVQSIKKLVALYPEEIGLKNDLGVKYLLSGKPNDARQVFLDVIQTHPSDGVALVHYGFILKTTDNNIVEGIKYLQKGIDTDDEGTSDGRFFFHLGDAYFRNNQPNKSDEVFEEAARRGLFPSKWQRSLYNVDHLVSQAWWTLDQTRISRKFKELEKHWKTIREEGMAQMDAGGSFLNEDENLRDVGDWKQFTLYSRGRVNKNNCLKVPKTCALLEKIPEATSCTRGQIKFSVMHPGTHVWPHTGPTNCRIRAHLGLVVPEGPRIRVTDDTRTWKEGKFLIFDDSFEHEVWHDGETMRLVLIVDIWHPDVTDYEKQSLSPI